MALYYRRCKKKKKKKSASVNESVDGGKVSMEMSEEKSS